MDIPNIDRYKLIVGKCEKKSADEASFEYFFLVPNDFVERRIVVTEHFRIRDFHASIIPIKVDNEQELLQVLETFLRSYHNVDREYRKGFPVVYAHIFERSGLKLPLFYKKFGEMYHMEILYSVTNKTFISWIDEIRLFYEKIPEIQTLSEFQSKKWAIFQLGLTHCNLLSETIVGLIQSAGFTQWRETLPELKTPTNNPSFDRRLVGRDTEEYLITNRFRQPIDSARLPLVQAYLQDKTVRPAWIALILKDECKEFFRLWIHYCREPEHRQFVSFPIFATVHPWIIFDAIHDEALKLPHGYKQKEFENYYTRMLAHPVVLQLFDESRNIQAFKNSELIQHFQKRIETMKNGLMHILSEPAKKNGYPIFSYFQFPASIFEQNRFSPFAVEPQYSDPRRIYPRYFKERFYHVQFPDRKKEGWQPPLHENRTKLVLKKPPLEDVDKLSEPQLEQLEIFGDINGKMYYFMTRVGVYLAHAEMFDIMSDESGPTDFEDSYDSKWTKRCNTVMDTMKFPATDMTRVPEESLKQNHDYISLLLLEQLLNYLELHEISIFVKCLEKRVKISGASSGRSSPEQTLDQILDSFEYVRSEQNKKAAQQKLNEDVLRRIKKSIDKRKKEEMECTAIFLEGLTNWKDLRHQTAAVYYAFLHYLQKQIILEKSYVNIRKYITTLSQYLDRNSKIIGILTYYTFEDNIFVNRLKEYISELPLELAEQTYDIFRLPLPEYFTKWIVKKSFVGSFDISQLKLYEQVVAEGGQASVHHCTTDKFYCPVVFKSFLHNSAHQDVFSELDSLILLQAHPHIVRLFGFVVKDGRRIGLLMEYCKGGSLDKMIEKMEYRFQEEMTVHWMGQAASGLAFLHANDVIHTDVKSPNMLLSSDYRVLKLSDMGYCKDVSRYDDKKAVYTSNKGTQGYIAPEIEHGEFYTTAADIFSLGRTLWSLIFKDVNPTDAKFAATVFCPLEENNSPLYNKEEFSNLSSYPNNKETIWKEYNEIKQKLPIVPERMASLLIRLTMKTSARRPKSEQIYQELREYYEELLRNMSPDQKSKLDFFPETRK